MHPATFFDRVIEHRDTLLRRFRETTPEAYFRHLLVGYKWMMDAIPAASPTNCHALAVNTRARPDCCASLDDVESALCEAAAEVRQTLERLTPEQCICGLLEHEIEHHGMIRWILKRYTGWDDNQMYQAEVL